MLDTVIKKAERYGVPWKGRAVGEIARDVVRRRIDALLSGSPARPVPAVRNPFAAGSASHVAFEALFVLFQEATGPGRDGWVTLDGLRREMVLYAAAEEVPLPDDIDRWLMRFLEPSRCKLPLELERTTAWRIK